MSQVKNKFIQDNAVDDAKTRLRTNNYLRSRNAANTADVNLLRSNSSDLLEAGTALSMANQKILNLLDPTSAQDAATKAYVDAVAVGLDVKLSVKAATNGALPACTYANGTGGVGAMLTGNVNGALSAQDGQTLSVNDRLLVKDEAAQLQNGIYTVTQVGSGGAPFILTRATDADTSAKVTPGLFTFVEQGTTQASEGWILTTTGAITLGTTALTFTQFTGAGEITAGSGIAKAGNTISVSPATSGAIGFDGSNNLRVIVDATNSTTKINGSNQLEGLKASKQTFTLSGTDITNQYIDLSQVAANSSIQLQVTGGPLQLETTDYTLNYTGGAGSKTRLTFAGDLATGGAAALVSGDILTVSYQYL